MALSFPGPSAVIDLTRSAVDQAVASASAVAALPARAFAVLDSIEALVSRINVVVDRAEAVLDRTDGVMDAVLQAVDQVGFLNSAAAAAVDDAARISVAAGVVIVQAELVASRATAVVAGAERATESANELLEAYETTLRKGAPMAARFVEQLTPEEVDSAIKLVDQLPKLTEHLTTDVLPILVTLDRVGPDIHALLAVTRDLKQAVAGIPGLRRLQRRGAERLGEQEATT